MGYKNPWKSAYFAPVMASIPMGIVAAFVYYGLHALVPITIVCLGIAVVMAVAVYFVAYLFFSKPTQEEMYAMPGGRTLYSIASKFGLCK